LDLTSLSATQGSVITSETLGHAQGGDIVINTALEPAHALSLAGRSRISASNGVLPGELLDVSNILNEDCAAAAGNNASSFILGGRGQLPVSPESGVSSLPCGSTF